jgi:hypothetical protein
LFYFFGRRQGCLEAAKKEQGGRGGEGKGGRPCFCSWSQPLLIGWLPFLSISLFLLPPSDQTWAVYWQPAMRTTGLQPQLLPSNHIHKSHLAADIIKSGLHQPGSMHEAVPLSHQGGHPRDWWERRVLTAIHHSRLPSSRSRSVSRNGPYSGGD